MSIAHKRMLLWMLSVTLIMGAAALMAYVLLYPPPPPQPVAGDTGPPLVLEAADETAIALSAFEGIWALQLRRPLYDPPPPAPPPAPAPPPPPPPPAIHLMGTIVEPSHTIGIFVLQGGKMELRRAGEKAGDVEIVKVEAERATILHHGREIVLEIAKEGR
jgi:hypothetical protein